MRALTKPNLDCLLILQTCIGSIDNPQLVVSFNGVTPQITTIANQYESFGLNATLFLIAPNHSSKETIVVPGITKKDFSNLYTQQMVGKTKPARQYYDVLRLNTPQGICPFCGVGFVKTLDHYLPKSKFPFFAVLPINLVPACKDCNTEKLSILAITADEQTLHPYYDHQQFIYDQWIFANVKPSVPISITYFVDPPTDWSDVSKTRVHKHFNAYALAEKFSIQAATEISSLLPLLREHFAPMGPLAIHEYLAALAKTEYKLHKNSWKFAMYQSLANDVWFCTIGYTLY